MSKSSPRGTYAFSATASDATLTLPSPASCRYRCRRHRCERSRGDLFVSKAIDDSGDNLAAMVSCAHAFGSTFAVGTTTVDLLGEQRGR